MAKRKEFQEKYKEKKLAKKRKENGKIVFDFLDFNAFKKKKRKWEKYFAVNKKSGVNK